MTIQNREVAFTSYQRGYVSRKTSLDNQPILHGKKGDYVLGPAFNTSRYCIRYYLK